MGTTKDPFLRKKISTNQVTGGRGEAFVAFLLSKYCLVRPVANGTDVGVDLYCEALIEDVPHSHFWIQVKATKSSDVTKKKIKVADLEYWSRQPIPVFIVLLNVEENLSINNFKLGIINLTEKFIATPFIKPTTKYKNLRSDFFLSDDQELRTFIFKKVPSTISRLWIRDGVIFPIRPTVHQQYVIEYDSFGLNRYAAKFMKNLGRTAALLLRDIISSKSSPDRSNERKQLEQILETYKDWGNYDFHYCLGLSKKQDNNYQGALVCFKKALNAIESDKKIDPKKTSLIRQTLGLYIQQMERQIRDQDE